MFLAFLVPTIINIALEVDSRAAPRLARTSTRRPVARPPWELIREVAVKPYAQIWEHEAHDPPQWA